MTDSIHQILPRLYDRLPFRTQLFIRIRLLLSDLYQLENYVPKEGKILDIGCGHGLLSNLLAINSPQREVLGIDIDAKKIDLARQTIGKRGNIQFEVGDANCLPAGSFHAVTIADVMYLIPPNTQRAILTNIASALKPNGVLVWKSQSHHPQWKYAITYTQELLMTKLGLTQGAGIFFMDLEESLQAIRNAGLDPVIIPILSHRPYSDILFLGHKV
jgi:2-polyprenyl-6-hydroxyphenyl methylase/3-demethylubiquinone-9 3-methyltransferase